MLNVQEFRDFKLEDLSKEQMAIVEAGNRTHNIECATIYYLNNAAYYEDSLRLLEDASKTFAVPADVLKFVLRI